MKTLGYYQIIGGIVGFILTIRVLISQQTLSGLVFMFFAIAFALITFSIISGNLLRKGNLKGLTLSYWNQIIQVLQLSLFAIGYEYYSGIMFRVGFYWSEKFTPDASVGISGWNLSYRPSSPDYIAIYVNIIPIIIIYLLGKIEKDIETRKKLLETAKQDIIANQDN